MVNLRKGTQQMPKVVIENAKVIDHIDLQLRLVEDDQYKVHLARVDMTGTRKRAEVFNLYKVHRAYFEDVIYVLAESEEGAVSQSMCDKPSHLSYTTWMDLERLCKVERVPFMIRSWGSQQF